MRCADYDLQDLPEPDVEIDAKIAQWRREERVNKQPKPASDDIHGQQAIPRFWSWGYVWGAYGHASTEQPEKALESLRTGLKTLCFP